MDKNFIQGMAFFTLVAIFVLSLMLIASCGPAKPPTYTGWQRDDTGISRSQPDKYGVVCYRFDSAYAISCVKV